jgi:CheY-like chemotaxis protein
VRVLLAEDNPVNQQVAAGLLTRRGHHVTIAHNGREAMERLAVERFDLVLMDLQMPVMGGLEATSEIRRGERSTGEHVRIVAMTAHAMDSDRERCLAAGMDGYLSKPFDPRKLFAVVEEVVVDDGAQVGVGNGLAFDEATLRLRLEDDDLMAAVIQVFLADLPLQLAAIEQAVASGDLKVLGARAHALKGAASSIAADEVFQAAERLERAPEAGVAATRSASLHLMHAARRLVEVLAPYAPPGAAVVVPSA